MRDSLSACVIKECILSTLGCYEVSLDWPRGVLVWEKRTWTDHRQSAQHLVEKAELGNLVGFINCLDEAKSLPPVSMYASDLLTLSTTVIVSTPPSPKESPTVDQSIQVNEI